MSEIVRNTTVAFEYPKEAIVSYAQTHEDVLLWRALHSVTPGFYVDVGAHDPTDLSVTRAFYERGWRGINVEPNPAYAEKLRRERPRDLTLQVALGDGPGEAMIYDFGPTGLSTLVKEIAKQHLDTGLQPAEFRVPVTTLAAALDDLGDQEIHFLKIDVEGYERQVLSGANFKKHRPWIVLIEAVRPTTTIASFGAWEPLLLEAGYQFAYFDGLNRFYVSKEHADLKRYFSVPVSIADPFRDYAVVRLSATIAALERDRMKHEVPRLEGDAQACDPQDAAGLLRIVEAQAADLVRLRRRLVAQQSRVTRLGETQTSRAEGESSDQARSNASPDLARVQATFVADASRRSPWRRLGRRLGVVRQLDWEAGGRVSDLAKPSGAAVPSHDGHAPARRSAGDVEPRHSPSSYEGFVELTNRRFLEECRDFAIDVILDVGANTGQFVQGLRAQGYPGQIVSFEPLSEAHAALAAAAASDPLWDVAEQCAIGAEDGWAEINIAGNSYSSSLLPMLDLHREAAPQSEYKGREPCRVITLDSYIERTFSDPTTLFAAKIDTQGYEAQVLAGLKRHHCRVKVVLCEMSVSPLYAHGPSMRELCHVLAGLNYRCVALTPEFEDPRTGELLQANGIFVKRD